MQPDAEHQQHHADLGELVCDALVGDKSGRERTDEDPGHEITHERGKSQPLRDNAEYESEHQGDDDGRDQRRVVRHRQKFLRSAGAPLLIPAALQLVLSFMCANSARRCRREQVCARAPWYHAGKRRMGSTLSRHRSAQGNSVRAPSPAPSGSSMRPPVLLGVACGAGAALFWAAGFVAARHGIAVGFSPADIVLHRFVWAGLLCLPLVVRAGLGDLAGVGWTRGVVLTLLGGPPLALFSYAGFLFVPLAHGGVIQPSCAALGGLVLASIVLKEKLAVQRAVGGAIIVAGLAVIGAEALTTIGAHGLIGDLSFATAGLMFAVFGTLLRLWRVAPTRAVVVTSVVSLVGLPLHWLLFGFDHMIELGLVENLIQMAMQGIFAGAGAIYLFTRSVVLLGAGRAAVFPSLVPGFTLLIGFLVLGEVPSLAQLVGLAIVLIGFRLVVKA